jgi:hypothetical protein
MTALALFFLKTFTRRECGCLLTFLFLICANANAQQLTPTIPDQEVSTSNRALPVDPPPPVTDTSLPPMNQVVLDVLHRMPSGGGYSVKREAFTALKSAITLVPPGSDDLQLNPGVAKPSFCSGATYLVFLETLRTLIDKGDLQLSPAVTKALLVNGQPDGDGIWGRWNANGPGTARLFYELKLGKNFSSLDSAKAGDFLKIFWNDEIGSKESGHSVIYLGRHQTAQGEMVRFWSSNIDVGFSEKEVSLTKIHRVLVSRLDNPAGIQNLALLAERDDYLAAMVTCGTSPELMLAMVGAKSHSAPAPGPGVTFETTTRSSSVETTTPTSTLTQPRH